ncbi:MAG: RNA polymerase sigma-70 factor (ECF subfamily) [Candidatus Poriferisodalaceae bacterium]
MLLTMTPSPVIELNRAVAVGMAADPAAGLELIDALVPRLGDYAPLFAARADLLRRSGAADEARVAYEAAIQRTSNDAERHYLEGRLNELK